LEEEIRASTDYEKVSFSTSWIHTEVVYISQRSSVHPHCETTVGGIGRITAACSRSLVWVPPSLIVTCLLSLPK
jgi:hypothetical protein